MAKTTKKNAYDEIECVYCARITYIYIYILMMIYAIQMDWNRKKKLFFSVWYHMRVFLSIAAYAAVLSLVLEFVALVREMLFHQISHDSESELLTKPYLDMNWKMNYLCFNHIFFLHLIALYLLEERFVIFVVVVLSEIHFRLSISRVIWRLGHWLYMLWTGNLLLYRVYTY